MSARQSCARVVASATLLLAAACGGGGDSVTDPGPPVDGPTLSRVRVTPREAAVNVGATTQLSASALDAYGRALGNVAVEWRALDPAVADVAGDGLVTGRQSGTARVVASAGGKADTATVVVSEVATPPAVATVRVSPDALVLQPGETGQLTATASDASGSALSGRTASWSSTAPGVATVSASGLVTAVATGVTSIVVDVEGKRDTAIVQVMTAVPASVTIVPGTVSLTVGGTQQLVTIVRDADNVVLTGASAVWSSARSDIATVSASGLVTAVGPGTTTVTARSGSATGTVQVTVTAPGPVRGSATLSAELSGTVAGAASHQMPGILVVGDNDDVPLAPLQSVALFGLEDVPAGATIESATLTLSMDAEAAFGSPFTLGALYAERATALDVNLAAPATDAVVVTSGPAATVTVDVAPLVRAALAGGQDFVIVRLRFASASNGNGVTDQLELSLGSLAISWAK